MKEKRTTVRFPKGEAAAPPTEKTIPGRPPQSEWPGTAIPCEALSPAQRESDPPRTEDAVYLDFIRRRPCSFCGNPNTIPHHVFKTLRGINAAGIAEKGSDYLAIPVCEQRCHRKIHNGSLRPPREELLQIIVINLICFLNEGRGKGWVTVRPRQAGVDNKTQNPPNFEWMDLRRLTQYAAVSERIVRTWIHIPVNPLPDVRVGGKTLVRKSVFDEWLELHLLKPTSPLDLGGMVDQIVAGVSGRK